LEIGVAVNSIKPW